MFRVFVFDLGGVVCFEDKKAIEDRIVAQLGIKRGEYLALSKRHMPAVTKGEITLLGFYKKIIDKTGVKKKARDILKTHISAYKKANTARDKRVVALIKRLRKTHTVACLTNTEPEIAKISRETGLFNLFDRKYVSTKMGLMKPDPRIYKKVIADLKVEPREIVYIDDIKKNIEAGKRVGLTGIYYEGYDRLKMDLGRRHISRVFR